jgi:DNA polymerase III delta prime subunit
MSNIYDFLKLSIENGRLSHSYFVLDRVENVSSEEIDMFSILLMENNEDDVMKGLAVERLFVEENEKQVIERKEVSRILEFTKMKPVFGLKRIVLIKNAHLFTKAAANHLLKILEEPPIHVMFFLISHKPNLLPATILSRCTIIKNHKEITNKENDAEQEEVFKKLETMSLNEKFFMIENLSKKDKKEIIKFLDNWLQYYFNNKIKETSTVKDIEMIRLIKETKSLVESTSANPRLMIERLSIKMNK